MVPEEIATVRFFYFSAGHLETQVKRDYNTLVMPRVNALDGVDGNKAEIKSASDHSSCRLVKGTPFLAALLDALELAAQIKEGSQ